MVLKPNCVMLLVWRGLTDDLDAGALAMDALEKVEKEIKKLLLRSDEKGMALRLAEFDKINKKSLWRWMHWKKLRKRLRSYF
uniref:Uncharacterized protein n=1 Tax=Nymphaea colorata TaxID=210225 RepID=A0A5K1EUG0_9MAGN|nr:unnamed protein product [Nymphaea colorata]